MNKNSVAVISSKENISNKKNCFAWLSNLKCNALNEKKCNGCRFYKHHSEVQNYSRYINKKDSIERRKSNETPNKKRATSI